MPNKTALLSAALGSLLLASVQASADDAKTEKCYGVAKAGSNDCASAGNNSCAGTSKADGDKTAWIYVPAGLCTKLVGGSLEPKA